VTASEGTSTAPLDPEDRYWAVRASKARLDELPAARATAEQWRNGLAGLTALLSAGSLVASPGLADHIPSPWRWPVGLIVLAGLLTLLYGASRAMNAAFGVPGGEIQMISTDLRDWEHNQATAALANIRQARRCFFAGLILIIAAAVLAFVAIPASSENLVQVTGRAGVFCGDLDSSTPRDITITSAVGTTRSIPMSAIGSIVPISNC
jgi:hypothetical protein